MQDTEKKTTRSNFLSFFVIAIVTILIYFIINQWNQLTGDRKLQSTNNAYIKSDSTTISARISGYVNSLDVVDFQKVKKGQLIATIDDREYVSKLDQAQASLENVKSILSKLHNEKALQKADIDQAKANTMVSQARYHQNLIEMDRYQKLIKSGFVSRQQFDEAKANMDSSRSTLSASQASVLSANYQLEVLEAEKSERLANVKSAEAEVTAQKLQLSYTRIFAPFDGTVNARRVQEGDLVSAGTQILTLVPASPPYVVANYKETQVKNFYPGLPVEISIDSYPEKKIKGRVESIAPASGSETALLPNENASGNFTKVVQRIAVRITLDPAQKSLDRLRPGMSVETTIDTAGEYIDPYSFKK